MNGNWQFSSAQPHDCRATAPANQRRRTDARADPYSPETARHLRASRPLLLVLPAYSCTFISQQSTAELRWRRAQPASRPSFAPPDAASLSQDRARVCPLLILHLHSRLAYDWALRHSWEAANTNCRTGGRPARNQSRCGCFGLPCSLVAFA